MKDQYCDVSNWTYDSLKINRAPTNNWISWMRPPQMGKVKVNIPSISIPCRIYTKHAQHINTAAHKKVVCFTAPLGPFLFNILP